MAAARSGAALVGRDVEIERLERFLLRSAEHGGAFVVSGHAGIGKSALLGELSEAAAAQGRQVLWVSGVESESRLPFAGLHQVLSPVLADSEDLDGPQRDALFAAFGMSGGTVPDLFLIALATLHLLAEAATRSPVLVVVEDAHWLDPSTADVLAFVARRLAAEPIAMVIAVREGHHSPLEESAASTLSLQPLDDESAAELLTLTAPDLAPELRQQVLNEAVGNPLALVELPSMLVEARAVPMWLPLSARLEHAFADRVAGLPPATRSILLIASLNDGDSLAETLTASSTVLSSPVTLHDLGPAMEARLVNVVDARVRFRHPLIRSAVHQRANLAQRNTAHAALAAAIVDDDRRVWHRAASCIGPDDQVADELELAAQHARQRGGIVATVAALERAADLTVDPVLRGARLMQAAQLAFELGRYELVERLLSAAEPLSLSPEMRLRATWIRESFHEGTPGDAHGAWALADMAEREATRDVDLALKMLWAAALRCVWAEPGPATRARVVEVADRMPVEPADARVLAILGFTLPIFRGAQVIDGLHTWPVHAGGDAESARLLGDAATQVGEFHLAAEFCAASLSGLRAQGRLALVARALCVQAWAAMHLVDLNVAIPAVAEAQDLARETRQPLIGALCRAIEANIAALRGDPERVDELAADAERVGMSTGANAVVFCVRRARALAALDEGRFDAAYRALRSMHDPKDPGFNINRIFTLPDLAESAVRSQNSDDVRAVMTEMEGFAALTPSPALHAGLRHARALLAAEDVAEGLFQRGLDADLRRQPFARARLQLAYGRWLRRRRHAADSRPYLRDAREAFDALGAAVWGEQARQELRAAGERSRQRVQGAQDQLTAQELQIAQLAADGLTNREIGQRLYLSHRTVSSHLHRIFPKVGIASRSELAKVLGSH